MYKSVNTYIKKIFIRLSKYDAFIREIGKQWKLESNTRRRAETIRVKNFL